ncbi:hypothetical protein LJC22_01945 [Desulfosarcina sp. OttesenSCG-928-G10]|nr:hypothetical protein [Desulfosarcina sp. OttesenSCG-928-G10]MDL2321484.1 hypothetical protein [Desulfosarcina sp. OttesenSCG-928-B08]
MKRHSMISPLVLLAMFSLAGGDGLPGKIGIAHAQSTVAPQERTVQSNNTGQSQNPSTSRQQTNTTRIFIREERPSNTVKENSTQQRLPVNLVKEKKQNRPSEPEKPAPPEEKKKRPKWPIINRPSKPETIHPPHYPFWPHRTTTVIRETQPVIVINNPPAEPQPPPKPEPKYLWVPPVMGKRTEPGHWEYGVQKIWMGDHWRYEQDETQKTWVPEKEVDYVQEPGYWDVVE